MTHFLRAPPVVGKSSLMRRPLSVISIGIGMALAVESQAGIPRQSTPFPIEGAYAGVVAQRHASVFSAPSVGARIRATSNASVPDRPTMTLAVQNCDDSGSGSLRDAVASSVSGDTIDLSGLACSTITLTSGAIIFDSDLTFDGPTASSLTVSGSNASVLRHLGTGNLGINNLTIANGKYSAESYAAGGCIYSLGSVNLVSSTVTNCEVGAAQRALGGAIFAQGDVSLLASSVTHSTATGAAIVYGGGVFTQGALTSKYSTIANNAANAPANGYYSMCGGICAGDGLDLESSTVYANNAQSGAGILADSGMITIVNSTISENVSSAAIYGGAVVLFDNATIRNSTITANTQTNVNAVFVGAGIGLMNSTLDLQSSIVAGNLRVQDGFGSTEDDINGIESQLTGANDIIENSSLPPPIDTLAIDPMLGPLADNGGLTLTHALLPGSPAMNAGNNAGQLSFDQRGSGFARVVGAAADIGAVESSTAALVPPTITKAFLPATIVVGAPSTLTITIVNTNATPSTLTADLTDTLPTPVVIASPANASTDCAGGSVSANSGGDSVTLSASAQIPSEGSCTVTVAVTATSAADVTNVIAAGQLQTDAGANANDATADLSVNESGSDTIFEDGFES